MAIPTGRSTGVVIDGVFLNTSRPKANQKGLLVNNKFFIPFVESSGGSGDTQVKNAQALSEPDTANGTISVRAVAKNADGTTSWDGDELTATYLQNISTTWNTPIEYTEGN